MRTLLCLALLFIPALVSGANSLQPRTGALLVASEQIGDPRFQHSVILLTRHDSSGTTGLILNRDLGGIPPAWEEKLHARPQGIYWGGPVSPFQVAALLLESSEQRGEKLSPGVELVTGERLIRMLHQEPPSSGELRVYLGYAGWAFGQLPREIDRGDWLVLPLEPNLLKLPSEQLWRQLQTISAGTWI